MALIWRNTFEGGTSGANITVTNSGGSSGHAFDNIFYNNASVPGSGSSAITYTTTSPLQGSVSALFNTTATNSTYLWWRYYSDTSEIRYVARMKFVYTAVPSSARTILSFRYAAAGVNIGTYVSTTAHIQLAGTGAPAGTTGAYTMIPGTTYVVQAYYTLESGAGGNGSVGWGLFDENDVLLDSYSSPANVATGTTIVDGIRFMFPDIPEWSTGKIDDVAFGGLASGWIGAPTTSLNSPVFSGYRAGGTGVGNTSVSINPNAGGSGSGGSACAVGDWMILIFTGGVNMTDINQPGNLSDWTVVRPFGVATGSNTFETGVWMKRRIAGETSYDWPLNGGTVSSSYWAITWYKNVDAAFAGNFWDRNGHATDITNIAPSVTTSTASSLVVSISTERTTATETDSGIAVNNSMTKRFFVQQPLAGGGDQNISVADKTLAVAGSSGDTTWTYPNTQANNGIAGHIWLTPTSGSSSIVPTVAGSAQATALNGGSLTLNVPGGYQAGDLLVATLRSQSTVSTQDWSNAAFSRIGPAFTASSSSTRVTGIFMHHITGTEPVSYTFTAADTTVRLAGALLLIRGASPSSYTYYNSATGDGITHGRTIPSYSAHDPSLVLEFAASEFASPNNHVPINYPDNFLMAAEATTSTNTGLSRTYIWVGTRELEGSTVTAGGPDTDIAWSVASAPVALSVAFQPATSTPPAAPDFVAKLGDTGGILVDAYVRVGDTGGTLSHVSGMRAMIPRYHTVTEMLAEPEFYWAHRGGSRDFPEMSSYAYGQSALLSYGGLELSLARTSDGIWFGLHDVDINRTSGTTGLGAASTMTWAQIETYQILGSTAANNTTQPSRPYARLEDILDTYAHHIFIVDIKYANAFREELLDILDGRGGPERFIGKSYGVGGTSFANSFTARGYKTWGYFYGSDIPSLTSAYVNQWTLIGMDYNASLADWNTLAGYRTNGQRMTGHICPDVSAITTARSKGASGFMVSGTVIVPPFAP